MAIWQDLVDDYRFPSRYASLRRFVAISAALLRPRRASSAQRRRARKDQVDYRDGPMQWPQTRKYRRTRLSLTRALAEGGAAVQATRSRDLRHARGLWNKS